MPTRESSRSFRFAQESTSTSSRLLSTNPPTIPQAESELSDSKRREDIDAVINQARILLLREMKPPLPSTTPDSDPAIKSFGKEWKAMVRSRSRDMLIEEEVRRRKAIKMNLANEGLEAKKKEEEVNNRKRKAEEDKNWEGTCCIILNQPPLSSNCFHSIENREQRVDSWRTFAKGPKKKKNKVQLLG